MDETPEPGDIVAIRHSYIDEVHAFIFVTEELSFSKNFLTTKAPYLLQSSSDVFAIFPVSFSCRHRDGNPGDCQTYANYFRCTSLDEYVQSRKVIVPTRYSELETIVREQELIVSKIEFEWKTNLPLQQASPQLLKEAQAVLTRIKREVNSNAEAISSTPDQRLLWSGLTFRIIGTLMSIDWI